MNHQRRKSAAPDAGAWHPVTNADRRLRPWLEIETSLSIAIARQCPADAPFRVRLLHEGAQLPILDEAPMIVSASGDRVHSRDVLLSSGDTPLVYAHTVLRREHLRHPWHHLVRIGTRPLGSLLFAHPRICPGTISYRRLGARHPLWRRAQGHIALASPTATLWARRAVFQLDGCPLLVTEVFLPGILTLPLPS
ncbi:MAG TPA: chorismate lyase [Rhodocyclaceae bacterium]|nr:chorismate lyase [Rhodocyclaceae bacterium]